MSRTPQDRSREAIERIRTHYATKGQAPPKGLPRRSSPIQRLPLPCVHRGEYTGETVSCASCGGNVKLKLHSCSIHGTCTLAKRVKGHGCCDATCAERPRGLLQLEVKSQQPATADPWASPVTVGAIPKLDLKPTRPRAVVTFAANEYGRQMWTISRPLMEAYAKRLDADLVVLDWPGPVVWPMGCKFQIPQVLDYYDRIIYADADVLFRPGCVDLFEMTPPGHVGGFSDLAEVLSKDPGFFAEFKRFRQFMGLPDGPLHPIPWYFNTGVLVLYRDHRRIMTVPDRPIPPVWCAEQHWWVASILNSGVPVRVLPKTCNWQWWPDPGWKNLPPPPEAVLHFSGMQDFEQRIGEMRKWVSR